VLLGATTPVLMALISKTADNSQTGHALGSDRAGTENPPAQIFRAFSRNIRAAPDELATDLPPSGSAKFRYVPSPLRTFRATQERLRAYEIRNSRLAQ
jgi:hypothetical protein